MEKNKEDKLIESRREDYTENKRDESRMEIS